MYFNGTATSRYNDTTVFCIRTGAAVVTWDALAASVIFRQESLL